MPVYSPNGYAAAVGMRSARTLLVEGKTDKGAIARLIVELRNRGRMRRDNVLIDTAEELRNETGHIRGNREKVEHAHAVLGTASGKFAALTDREFRYFDLAALDDLLTGHRTINGNLFWTRGHSIENYFFTQQCIRCYLEQAFPEHLPHNYGLVLSRAFDTILRETASLCLAGLQAHVLNKLRGIRRIEHWTVAPDELVRLNATEIAASLSARSVDPDDCLLFRSFLEHYRSAFSVRPLQLARWVVRGHTGFEFVWTGVAKLLQHHAFPSGESDKLAYREIDEKCRCSAAYWAQQIDSDSDAPLSLIQWLTS